MRGMDATPPFRRNRRKLLSIRWRWTAPQQRRNSSTPPRGFRQNNQDSRKRLRDRYINGDPTALTEDALRGMDLFLGKASCSTCHTPPLFTNNKIRKNQKNATFSGKTDPGAGFVGTGPNLYFNVPQLRGLILTGPYMHNGALGTLGQVVRFYNQSLSLGLTTQEIRQLVEFLRSL
jgi:cytochrome c peroxidase